MKILKTNLHSFEIDRKEHLEIVLKGVLNAELYNTVIKNSSGFLKIHPSSTKDNLERLKDRRPGEEELLNIINKLLDRYPREQFMILFRK